MTNSCTSSADWPSIFYETRNPCNKISWQLFRSYIFIRIFHSINAFTKERDVLSLAWLTPNKRMIAHQYLSFHWSKLCSFWNVFSIKCGEKWSVVEKLHILCFAALDNIFRVNWNYNCQSYIVGLISTGPKHILLEISVLNSSAKQSLHAISLIRKRT